MGQRGRVIGPAEIVGIAVVAVLVLVAVGHRTGWTWPGTTGEAATASEPVTAAVWLRGTPAEAYPLGAAGITLPAATAVPGFSAAEVGSALGKVRAAMIAGRLDQRMLTGHDMTGFLGLLAPAARDQTAKHFTAQQLTSIATRIDPAAKLDPAEQPRVSGRMTVAGTRSDGVDRLQITTNFVWVYAFNAGNPPVAAVHDEILWEVPKAANLRPDDQGLWVRQAESYSAWMDCDAYRKGLLAPGGATPVAGTGADGDPEDVLRADHGFDKVRGTC
ncbi:hypothetical protein Ait01nite_088490 [Actinoplanes italicus]|uniref:Uncharacterized protein n=1 Tax=Actinoplanes italicus TaxID=113567 RepID=A0A2T0JWM1_9ACTN|nr:hypothetical protein [Actinoplanes italicus]PRX12168.1 hypothetical protein CLV67_12925 [Actinoplanes italicus]GIE35804.1 hypothetical protein Ait01nite_088490 [Actinoplanes italicus]